MQLMPEEIGIAGMGLPLQRVQGYMYGVRGKLARVIDRGTIIQRHFDDMQMHLLEICSNNKVE